MITVPQNLHPDRMLAVYSLSVAIYDVPIWIGILPAATIFKLSDTRRNPHVCKLIADDGNPKIVIHLLTDDLAAAKICAHQIRHVTPSAATIFADFFPSILGRRVQKADGTIYASASEAARANRISASNLSKHLNRKSGYATVGGCYYTWLTA